MSLTSSRRAIVEFNGDYTLTAVNEAADNANTPAAISDIALITGANTITPPTGVTGVTLLMPAGNTAIVTLKGVSGDTGVALHITDPSSIGLNGSSTFVLSASAGVTVRLMWS